MKDKKQNEMVKDERIIIRISKGFRQDLDHLSFVSGKSKSDILREGFELYKKLQRNS